MLARIVRKNGETRFYEEPKAAFSQPEEMCCEGMAPLNCWILETKDKDLSFLEDLPIESLQMSGGELTEYGEHIDVKSLTSLNGLQYLPGLRKLYVTNMPVTEIHGIEFCQSLELAVFNTKIQDFSLLSGLPLKSLEILPMEEPWWLTGEVPDVPQLRLLPATGMVLPSLRFLTIDYFNLDWLATWSELPRLQRLKVKFISRSNKEIGKHPTIVLLRLKNPNLRVVGK